MLSVHKFYPYVIIFMLQLANLLFSMNSFDTLEHIAIGHVEIERWTLQWTIIHVFKFQF